MGVSAGGGGGAWEGRYKDESNEWLDLLKLLLRWFCYCYLGFERPLVIIITNNLFEFFSEYFS